MKKVPILRFHQGWNLKMADEEVTENAEAGGEGSAKVVSLQVVPPSCSSRFGKYCHDGRRCGSNIKVI